MATWSTGQPTRQPFTWPCSLFAWLLWGICMQTARWDPVRVFWCGQGVSSSNHPSLSCDTVEATDINNMATSTTQWTTCNQRAFICDFWWPRSGSAQCPQGTRAYPWLLGWRNGYNVIKMHDFTDGWAAQCKSLHCIGDFFCSLADFGFHIVWNYMYFETSRAKENKMLQSHMWNRAWMSTLCRILTACCLKLRHKNKPCATEMPWCLLLHVYVPDEGLGAINRSRQERKFKEVKEIRKWQCVKFVLQQKDNVEVLALLLWHLYSWGWEDLCWQGLDGWLERSVNLQRWFSGN